MAVNKDVESADTQCSGSISPDGLHPARSSRPRPDAPCPSRPKVAFITGASSGIGAAYARRLAVDGYDLIIHGRREQLLNKLADEITTESRERGCPVTVEVITAELADPEQLAKLEKRIKETPDLAMLINNAGYNLPRSFHNSTVEENEAILRVHLTATVRLTHAALPILLKQPRGAIINVSSVAAFLVSRKNAMYCATKAFLNTFTESLHLELQGTPVRVQTLCPGFTLSDFHTKLGYAPDDPRFAHFMSPEKVVDVSLRDLAKGKVVSVPGLRYKLAAVLAPVLPRRILYWLAAKRA